MKVSELKIWATEIGLVTGIAKNNEGDTEVTVKTNNGSKHKLVFAQGHEVNIHVGGKFRVVPRIEVGCN